MDDAAPVVAKDSIKTNKDTIKTNPPGGPPVVTLPTGIFTKYAADQNSWNIAMYSNIPSSGAMGNFVKMATDNAGNIIVLMSYYSPIDIDPGANINVVGGVLNVLAKYTSKGQFVWSQTITNNYDLRLEDLTTDAAGNIFVVVTSFSKKAVTIGSSIIHPLAESRSSIVAKLDNNGKLLWTRMIAINGYWGGGGAELYHLTTDNTGTVYAVGKLLGIAPLLVADDAITDLPVTPALDGVSTTLFVISFDNQGTYKWVRSIADTREATLDNYKPLIRTDNKQGYYITGYKGYAKAPSSFNIIDNDSYNSKFIAKLDNNGNPLWFKTYDGNLGKFGACDMSTIVADFDSNLYVGGADENQNYSTILKVSPDGADVWQKRIVTNFAANTKLFIDNQNQLLVAGGYIVNTQMLKDLFNSNHGIYFNKYSLNGDLLWTKQIAGYDINTYNYLYDVVTDNYGHIDFAGYFAGRIKLMYSPSLDPPAALGPSNYAYIFAQIPNAAN